MNKYNLDKLVKVECNDFYPSRYYTYREAVKILGFVIQKEGIYSSVFDRYVGPDVPKYHTLIDGKVYENAEVILHYEAGHAKVYYFNSFSEAIKFSDEITALGRWQA